MTDQKHVHFGKWTYSTDYLETIERLFQRIITDNSYVFFIRVDLHFPEGYYEVGQNKELTALLHHLREHYRYHGIDFAYIWAREQDESDVPHYHLVFLFNGSRINDGRSVQNEAAKAWHSIVGLTGYECVRLIWSFEGHTGIMIQRPTRRSEGEMRGKHTPKTA